MLTLKKIGYSICENIKIAKKKQSLVSTSCKPWQVIRFSISLVPLLKIKMMIVPFRVLKIKIRILF